MLVLFKDFLWTVWHLLEVRVDIIVLENVTAAAFYETPWSVHESSQISHISSILASIDLLTLAYTLAIFTSNAMHIFQPLDSLWLKIVTGVCFFPFVRWLSDTLCYKHEMVKPNITVISGVSIANSKPIVTCGGLFTICWLYIKRLNCNGTNSLV